MAESSARERRHNPYRPPGPPVAAAARPSDEPAATTAVRWGGAWALAAAWVALGYGHEVYVLTRARLWGEVLSTGATGELAAQRALVVDLFAWLCLAGGVAGGAAMAYWAPAEGRRRVWRVALVALGLATALTSGATHFAHVAMLRMIVGGALGGVVCLGASLVASLPAGGPRWRAGLMYVGGAVLGTALGIVAVAAAGAEWRTAYLAGMAAAPLALAGRAVVRDAAPHGTATR